MVDRAVAPLDLGRFADHALPVGQEVARKLGARLDAVIVASPGIDPGLDEHEPRWHARLR